MKKMIIALAIFLAANSGAFAQDSTHNSGNHEHKMTTSKKTTSKGVKYTCTMHPEVVMNKAGKCPKCGMNLIAVKSKTTKKEKPMGKMKM